MEDRSVSIHIVNWNGGSTILDCLASVAELERPGSVDTIVVDNASSDGSLKTIEMRFPKIKVVRNYANLGFSKAHNQAIQLSASEFVLVLNFDVILKKDFLFQIVNAMTADSRNGMASGKLYRLIEGKKTDILDSTGIEMIRYFSSPRGSGEKDRGRYDVPACRKIFGPCGAAALYRREMLEDIRYQQEYFDEDFVNYVEDVDLSWRAQLCGWKGVYVPEALAFHERGVTRKHNTAEQVNYQAWGYRNRYLTMYKNIPRFDLQRFFLKFCLFEIIFLLGFRSGGVSAQVKIKSFRDAMALRSIFRKKREYVQGRMMVEPVMLADFFGYEKFNIVLFMLQKVLRVILGGLRALLFPLLSKFSWGRDVIDAYQTMKANAAWR